MYFSKIEHYTKNYTHCDQKDIYRVNKNMGEILVHFILFPL